MSISLNFVLLQERKHCSHGVTLCTGIMKAYDMSMSGSSNRRQLGETLGILLASSTTAKSAALASEIMIFVQQMRIFVLG